MKALNAAGNAPRTLNSECFKRCPVCGHEWPTREAFLGDADLTFVGYQASFRQLQAGLFLFNHTCRGTLAVLAMDFEDLHTGPVFTQRLTGTAACPGHCLHADELAPCPASCECRFVRDLIQVIRDWPRRPSPAGSVNALKKERHER